MECRNCKKKKLYQILDLGIQPLANEYLNIKDKKKKRTKISINFGGLLQMLACSNISQNTKRKNFQKKLFIF